AHVAKVMAGALFAAHLDEWLAASRATEKTQAMQRADVKRFAKEFPALANVTKPEVRRWCDRTMSDEGLTLKTMQRVLSALRGYWSYLQSLEAAPAGESPFKALSLKDGGRVKDDKRKPFAPADVVKLCNAALAADDRELADIVSVAMWSGARIEEVCSLKVERVNLTGKLPSFKVAEGKTDAALREVPVHASLRPVLARLIGDRTEGYVFADLTENKYGDRSNAPGKRFGYLKSRLGFGPQFVFHSIRKTVATMFENAGVPENVAADIIGHEKPTMTYGLYSGGSSLATKHAAVKKLSYEEEGKAE
ncbi:MAG: tyrosine-type recombinase/integrase, partial [Stellaceae bacterium]